MRRGLLAPLLAYQIHFAASLVHALQTQQLSDDDAPLFPWLRGAVLKKEAVKRAVDDDDAPLFPWLSRASSGQKVPVSLADVSPVQKPVAMAAAVENSDADSDAVERRQLLANLGRVQEDVFELQSREEQQLSDVREVKYTALLGKLAADTSLLYWRIVAGVCAMSIFGTIAWVNGQLRAQRIATDLLETNLSNLRSECAAVGSKSSAIVSAINSIVRERARADQSLPVSRQHSVDGVSAASCEYYCLVDEHASKSPRAVTAEEAVAELAKEARGLESTEVPADAADEWWDVPAPANIAHTRRREASPPPPAGQSSHPPAVPCATARPQMPRPRAVSPPKNP